MKYVLDVSSYERIHKSIDKITFSLNAINLHDDIDTLLKANLNCLRYDVRSAVKLSDVSDKVILDIKDKTLDVVKKAKFLIERANKVQSSNAGYCNALIAATNKLSEHVERIHDNKNQGE